MMVTDSFSATRFPSSNNIYDPIPISKAEEENPFGEFPPSRPKDDLFSPTGWGPAIPLRLQKPHKYAGAPYPAPMKPQADDNEDKSTLCRRARRAWAKCQFDKALERYDNAILANQGDVNLWFERAQLLWAAEEYDWAEKTIRYALELNPEHIPSYVTLIRLRIRARDFGEAGILMGRMIFAPEGRVDSVRRALCHEMMRL